MNRRNSQYSYLTDPSSHVAHDNEKNTKCTAKTKLVNRSDNNHTGLIQENNLYQSSLKSRRPSDGSVTKNETESNLVQRVQQTPVTKCNIAQSQNRWESNNTQESTLPVSQWEEISPQARGAMSFQVKQRRMNIRALHMNDNRKDKQKMENVKPGRKISAFFDENSQGEVAREAPLSPRKISSKDIEKKPVIKSAYSNDGNILEAICSGDCVADMEDVTADVTMVDISRDDFGEKFKHLTSHRSSRKDVQTQTLLSGGDIFRSRRSTLHHVRGMKRTETWQSHTTTLYARRSHSDTSIRRTKRSERQSTSPSQFVAKSTEFCKRITTECCVRSSMPPAQFLVETTDISNCHTLTATTDKQPSESSAMNQLSEPEAIIDILKPLECNNESLPSYTMTRQSLAMNQLSVPETITDILKPLESNNESLPRCTMTRGVALSLAASFLLFLGLMWTGISVSLVTHRIVTQYLYPPEPDANKLSQFLRRLYTYVGAIASWVWYNVLY